jgi:hypothetical protein
MLALLEHALTYQADFLPQQVVDPQIAEGKSGILFVGQPVYNISIAIDLCARPTNSS